MISIKKIVIILIFTLFFTSQVAPTSAAPKSFYLDLKKGCYAGNSPTTSFLEWSGPNYKTLYRTSCRSRYHYQVYAITKLSVSLAGEDAQNQASDRCGAALARIVNLGKVDPYLGIGWFFPDEGAEEQKYGKKLICFVRMSSPSDEYLSVVQTKPLI